MLDILIYVAIALAVVIVALLVYAATKPDNFRVQRTTEINAGYEEAYIRELEGFSNAIVNGAPSRNPPEEARRDQSLLCGLALWHASRSSQ